MEGGVKAIAIYANDAEDPDELSFRMNDMLIVVKENFQNGWHLCEVGGKRGVAPANYLRIMRKPAAPSPEDIYDLPKSRTALNNPSDADYMNMTSSSMEDIYMNTSGLSNSAATASPIIAPPVRSVAPKKLINYPAVIPKLSTQTSEYMVMGGSDYIDIDDYDEPPTSADYVPFDGVAKNSNESVGSSFAYPYSSESLPSSNKVSSESVKSYDSGISSSKQDQRDSPPVLPEKRHHHHAHLATQGVSDEEHNDYMCPPPTAPRPAFLQTDKRSSDHDYFHPAETPPPPPAYPPPPSSSPPGGIASVKHPPLVKKSSQASAVVNLDGEYEQSKWFSSSPLSEKKKKKQGSAAVDQLPKFFSNLTLRKNKNGSKAGGSPRGRGGSMIPLSKSLENLNKVSMPAPPPVAIPPPGPAKTRGEVSGNMIDYMKCRPLPPTPDQALSRSAEELEEEDDEEQRDYAEIEDGRGADPLGPPPSLPAPLPPNIRSLIDGRRSQSLANSPVSLSNQRRHSTPHRPDVDVHMPKKKEEEEEDDYHDYTDIPDNPCQGALGGVAAVTTGSSCTSSGYHSSYGSHGGYEPHPLRDSSPFVSSASLSDAKRTPPPVKGSPPSSIIPVQTVEIDVWRLSATDKALIRDHCGQISSVLLRTTTEALIRLKEVTDLKQVELYIPACAATGSGSIEMIKHLTVVADQCFDPALRTLTTAHRNKLKEVVKRLVEAVKVAKVQYPALVAHTEMVTHRNELISTVLEIKTFVVRLLHAPP